MAYVTSCRFFFLCWGFTRVHTCWRSISLSRSARFFVNSWNTLRTEVEYFTEETATSNSDWKAALELWEAGAQWCIELNANVGMPFFVGILTKVLGQIKFNFRMVLNEMFLYSCILQGAWVSVPSFTTVHPVDLQTWLKQLCKTE